MGSWNAIYLRGAIPSGVRVPLEGELPVRRLGPWTELALPGVEDGEPTARALSAQAPGPLLWVLIQTTASVLSVVHFESGQVLRRAEYADGSWRRVEGTPQPWEDALFSATALEEALEDERDEAEVRAVFAAKTLTEGSGLPRPREWEAMWAALGVDAAGWKVTRQSAPSAVIVGSATSRTTVLARLSLAFAVLATVAGFVTHGDARALSFALAVPLFVLALGAAALRRASSARWLF